MQVPRIRHLPGATLVEKEHYCLHCDKCVKHDAWCPSCNMPVCPLCGASAYFGGGGGCCVNEVMHEAPRELEKRWWKRVWCCVATRYFESKK